MQAKADTASHKPATLCAPAVCNPLLYRAHTLALPHSQLALISVTAFAQPVQHAVRLQHTLRVCRNQTPSEAAAADEDGSD